MLVNGVPFVLMMPIQIQRHWHVLADRDVNELLEMIEDNTTYNEHLDTTFSAVSMTCRIALRSSVRPSAQSPLGLDPITICDWECISKFSSSFVLWLVPREPKTLYTL